MSMDFKSNGSFKITVGSKGSQKIENVFAISGLFGFEVNLEF